VDSNVFRRNTFTGSGYNGVELWNASNSALTFNNIRGNSGGGVALNGSIVTQTADLAAGLVGHWKMDEAIWTGAPGEVADSSGMGNPGTAEPPVPLGPNTVASGVIGRAGSFDGADDQVRIPNSGSISPLNSVSAAGRFNTTSLSGITGSWVSKRDAYIMHPNTDGTMQFYVNVGGGWAAANSAVGSIQPGAWEHGAGTNDGATIRLCRNGIQLGETSASGLLGVSGDLYLGSDAGCGCGSRFFNGLIDDVRVYSRGINDAEVRALAMAPPPQPANWGNSVRINTISNNAGSGLLVAAGGGATVAVNNISGNAVGFDLDRADNSTLTENLVGWNLGYGARSMTASRDSLVYGNNFLSNNGGGTQASDSAGPNRWNETYTGGRGNWWSDHTTPDVCDGPAQSNCGANPGGVVDTPYALDGSAGAMDRYPLTTYIPSVPEASPLMALILVIALAGITGILSESARRRSAWPTAADQ
jgi:hypothetical protein